MQDLVRIAVMMEFSDTNCDPPKYMGTCANEFYKEVIQDAVARVFEHRSETAYNLSRADRIRGTNDFTRDIFRLLFFADVVIFDLTNRNANVLYELGIRHTLGLASLLLASDVQDLPSDVNHCRAVIYGSLSDKQAAIEMIARDIAACLDDVENYERNPVSDFMQHPIVGDHARATMSHRFGVLDEMALIERYPLNSMDKWLAQDATITIIGRSVEAWSKQANRWNLVIPDNLSQVKFSFIIVDPEADLDVLPRRERNALRKALLETAETFLSFAEKNRGRVSVRFLKWIPLESMNIYEPLKGGTNVLQWDIRLSNPHRFDYNFETKERLLLETTDAVPSQAGIYRMLRERAYELSNRARE